MKEEKQKEEKHLYFKNGEYNSDDVYYVFGNLGRTALELSTILNEELEGKIVMEWTEAARLITAVQNFASMVSNHEETVVVAMEEANGLYRYLKARNLENDYNEWRAGELRRNKLTV